MFCQDDLSVHNVSNNSLFFSNSDNSRNVTFNNKRYGIYVIVLSLIAKQKKKKTSFIEAVPPKSCLYFPSKVFT